MDVLKIITILIICEEQFLIGKKCEEQRSSCFWHLSKPEGTPRTGLKCCVTALGIGCAPISIMTFGYGD